MGSVTRTVGRCASSRGATAIVQTRAWSRPSRGGSHGLGCSATSSRSTSRPVRAAEARRDGSRLPPSPLPLRSCSQSTGSARDLRLRGPRPELSSDSRSRAREDGSHSPLVQGGAPSALPMSRPIAPQHLADRDSRMVPRPGFGSGTARRGAGVRGAFGADPRRFRSWNFLSAWPRRRATISRSNGGRARSGCAISGAGTARSSAANSSMRAASFLSEASSARGPPCSWPLPISGLSSARRTSVEAGIVSGPTTARVFSLARGIRQGRRPHSSASRGPRPWGRGRPWRPGPNSAPAR